MFVEAPARPVNGRSSRQQRRLLFVSSIIRGKGLDILLKAMTMLPPDTTLDVVGDGPQRTVFEDIA